MGQSRWWVLSFLAALVLLGSAGGFLKMRLAPRAVPAPLPPLPRQRCPNLDAEVPLLPAEPEQTLLLVTGVGKVRAFVDGKPALGAPDEPKRFVSGEHLLRAEAEGAEPLELHLRLEPFLPAFVHLQVDPQAGITFATLGAGCVSCAPPEARASLDFTRVSDADPVLLAEAAKALRASDWRGAAGRLRGVSPKSRAHALFLRLAADVYQFTAQPQLAQASLARVPANEGHELDAVFAAWSALTFTELTRTRGLPVRRWNLLTEKFSKLLEKFALDAPGPVQVATGRLAELTEGFLKANASHDTAGEDETVHAAEDALKQFVRALRRSRPEDCEFQKRITASL